MPTTRTMIIVMMVAIIRMAAAFALVVAAVSSINRPGAAWSMNSAVVNSINGAVVALLIEHAAVAAEGDGLPAAPAGRAALRDQAG